MANPFYVSPLGGFSPGDKLNQLRQQSEQRELNQQKMGMAERRLGLQEQQFEARQQQQEQQQQLQQKSKELALRMQQGDLSAAQELYAINPQMGAQIDQGLGIQDEKQAAQVGGWLEQYLATPKDKRGDFLQRTAAQTPISVDDDLLAMDPAERDQYATMLAGRYLNKQQIDMLQGQQPQPMTEYQQEQVRLEEQKLDLRKLENEERALDRELARETNQLKREELESKIEQNKAKQEQAKRDKVAEQDASIARFDNAISTINKIEQSPGFSASVGARIPFIDQLPGSDAQETIGLIDTLKSQSFLSEIQQMKGMGALSNAEGAKLESAISSLNRNMKEEAFKRSLNTIRDYFTVAKERAQKQMGREPQPAQVNEAEIMAKYGIE